jgi:hypothetical protein
MKSKHIATLKKLFSTSLLISVMLFNPSAQAHTAGATLGADGASASATGLAAVSCFDDGNGQPAGLFVQIKDLSSPVPGLLISVQLYKGTQATNITDTLSGDANHSEGVQLDGGAGVYWMIVNKTNVGSRAFEIIWHCMTSNHTHTGTDILVRQFQ